MANILTNLQLKLIKGERARYDNTWGYSSVTTFGRLYFPLSGTATIKHQGRAYVMRPERMYMIPAQVPMECFCPKEIEMDWVHFDAMIFGGVNLFDFVPCRYEVRVVQPRRVHEFFTRMYRLMPRVSPRAELERTGLLAQLLALFVKNTALPRVQLDERLQAAINYIGEHLHEPLNVRMLAKLSHMERSYFSVAFAKGVGEPPAQFIRRRRVEAAMRMLVESDLKLDAVARQCGFYDAFHLSKLFKQQTGRTPSSFRKEGRQA